MNLKHLLKSLMGSNHGADIIVEEKRQEARGIKSEMADDVAQVKKKVDDINKHTNKKLKEIGVDIKTLTYKYALATGAKRRGL